MAGGVLKIKVCSPLKLRSGLTGNYHAICHYSYNLPLAVILGQTTATSKFETVKNKSDEKSNFINYDFSVTFFRL